MTENHIDLTVDTAGAIRMAFLMTHYRSPCEIGPKKIEEARKILRRFAMACEPYIGPPPLEIIEAVSSDLNTPGAIALMHRYRKAGKGRELFASLRFLGFFGGTFLPDEIKTLPPDHEWSQPIYIGLDAVGEA